MAIVRTAVAAKLEADPSFHLKIHQDQLIQIKSVHPLVNNEGKKRLADFTVECSDADFVLIMENLTLKRVLNIMAVCNPTITLDFRMDIGISKNQIGCADPFGACYVKCNSSGRNKNHPRYIQYPSDAKDVPNNNNTNVVTAAPAIEIKLEKQPEPERPAAVSKRRGRPAKPKAVKEEIVKPIEVTPAPSRSLKDFFGEMPLDPQLSSPQPISNNNTNEINVEEQHTDAPVETIGADVDPVESPGQAGTVPLEPSIEVQANHAPAVNTEDNSSTLVNDSNVSAADPVNTESSLMDQTLNEVILENVQDTSKNDTNKNDNGSQDVPMAESADKNVLDQIPVDMDLATTMEMSQYTANATEDDKNNTTDDSMMNQEEMAEIFKEIFPEYYSDNNNVKTDTEFTEINGMLFDTEQPVVTVPMETEPAPQAESSSNERQPDPAPQEQPMQMEESAVMPPDTTKEGSNEEKNDNIAENKVLTEHVVPQVDVTDQVASVEVQTEVTTQAQNLNESIVTDTRADHTDKTQPSTNVDSSDNGPKVAIGEVWSGMAVPLAITTQPVQPEVSPVSSEVTRVIENVTLEVDKVSSVATNEEPADMSTPQDNPHAVEHEHSLAESDVAEPRQEPRSSEQNSATAVLEQNMETNVQQKDGTEENDNTIVEPSKDVSVDNMDVQTDQTNNSSNGLVAETAIPEEDEDLDLNEIVYDGEIVVQSDNEDSDENNEPLIDFFCEETLADDENEDEEHSNTNEYNMIDDGPQTTRKRKRRFSLESVVFRNVKQKVGHVTVKDEPKDIPEKEITKKKTKKDAQMSPILRAIFSSKTSKNNNTSANDDDSPSPNNTNRRLTRSGAKNNSNSSEVSVESTSSAKTRKIPKRRASAPNETKVKKENQAVDSPRILIYSERTRKGPLPKKEKKETKPKKETKVKVTKKSYSNEEEKSKYSDEDYMSINSDEDSVEYHVDKLDEDEYFVEEILEKKIEKGKTQYLIKWLGWPHSDNTWTPEEDISPDIIEIYNASPKQRNPGDRNILVYNLFWKYAFRRHVRYVKEHPEDPNYENCKDIDVSDGLLDKFSMCNCYRVLDAGSIYFKEQVARMQREEDEDDETKQTIWMAFCYRLVNRLTTFEGFGRIPTSRQWPQFKKYLINIRATGDPVFTNRHNVIGLENYLGVMDNLTSKIDVLYDKFERRTSSLQKCIEYAQTLPFIGPFFAQQICNDLVEEGIISGSNNWVCLGPGAKAGLRNIYPGIKNSELLDRAKELQKNQRKAFKSLDFDFPFYKGQDLSLIDIEHVLCEFQKYLRMLGKKSSKKNLRNKYKNDRSAKKRSSRNK